MGEGKRIVTCDVCTRDVSTDGGYHTLIPKLNIPSFLKKLLGNTEVFKIVKGIMCQRCFDELMDMRQKKRSVEEAQEILSSKDESSSS